MTQQLNFPIPSFHTFIRYNATVVSVFYLGTIRYISLVEVALGAIRYKLI